MNHFFFLSFNFEKRMFCTFAWFLFTLVYYNLKLNHQPNCLVENAFLYVFGCHVYCTKKEISVYTSPLINGHHFSIWIFFFFHITNPLSQNQIQFEARKAITNTKPLPESHLRTTTSTVATTTIVGMLQAAPENLQKKGKEHSVWNETTLYRTPSV